MPSSSPELAGKWLQDYLLWRVHYPNQLFHEVWRHNHANLPLASELLSNLDSSNGLSDDNPSNYFLLQLLQSFPSYHGQMHIVHHLTASKATRLNICFSAPLLHQSQPQTFCCNFLIPASNTFCVLRGKIPITDLFTQCQQGNRPRQAISLHVEGKCIINDHWHL